MPPEITTSRSLFWINLPGFTLNKWSPLAVLINFYLEIERKKLKFLGSCSTANEKMSLRVRTEKSTDDALNIYPSNRPPSVSYTDAAVCPTSKMEFRRSLSPPSLQHCQRTKILFICPRSLCRCFTLCPYMLYRRPCYGRIHTIQVNGAY